MKGIETAQSRVPPLNSAMLRNPIKMPRRSLWWSLPLMLGLTGAVWGQVTQPAQKPLLSTLSEAKPNLMVTVDNSGSMAFPFHETYGVPTDSTSSIELRRCPANQWSDFTGSWVQGGLADLANSNRCIYQSGADFFYTNTSSLSYVPQRFASGAWSAQRSVQVNPVYYDPRVTYAPRIDVNGTPLVPTDNLVWVSNQTSAAFRYEVFQNSAGQLRTTHSMFATNPNLTGFTSTGYLLTSGLRIPQHTTYTTVSSTTPGFTYSNCSNVTTFDGLQVGCTTATNVTVLPVGTGNITLPTGHDRTDCAGGSKATTCSHALEVANIMNWFRYYSNRQLAANTAIAQALNGDAFQRKMRVGYMPINNNGAAIALTPGTDLQPSVLRGVRELVRGSTTSQEMFTWLYGMIPYGGTPLHNSIDRIASYYRVGSTTAENPWAANPSAPASTSNPERSCRRSFNILFSDGAWTASTSTNAGKDHDNLAGPAFTRTGTTETFSYSPTGPSTAEGRKQYTPYPSTATGGLADLTALYFWHEDLRALNNEISTRPGQPTFWQNMATYTVGYLIRPTGEVQGATSGLTFAQITKYQGDYATLGYAAATKPQWPSGDLTKGAVQSQIDDFIQAGFTGGGKGFSVSNATQVRSAFNTILSEIANGAGRDAGVAVSSDNTATSITGSLKYSVEYQTADNSGEVIAETLTADGSTATVAWRASQKIPAHGDRRVFTRSTDSSTTGAITFTGVVSALPVTVQAALRYGPDASRVATGTSAFVDYLRGKDPVTDASGVLYRQRSSKLGAMVNPPSVLMGGALDFAYDLDKSTVTGTSTYQAFVKTKQSLPASLFVATNAGMVHSLNAATGDELAAFMPRRALKRMLPYAKSAYTFEYIVDGPISEHDLYDGKSWNHVAVGTGGRGERLIYAIRSPLSTKPAGRTPDSADFLWEVGPTTGPLTVGSTTETNTINTSTFALGYITNPARSGQTVNGEWIVAVNSGHYNGIADGKNHGLLVLNAMTGATIKRIPLPTTYDAGRGLGGITLMRNDNRRVFAAYAGDAKGNLWRFDLKGKPEDWAVSYGRPIFTTEGNRPIYGAPAWQAHPKGGTIVVAATGMLLDDADASNPSDKESIYGVWDPTPMGSADVTTFTTVPLSELLVQGIDTTKATVTDTPTERIYYQTSKNKIEWKVGSTGKHRGWRFPLARDAASLGERSIDQIRNIGTSVFINTLVINKYIDIDSENCAPTAKLKNFIYGLRALDGVAQRSFDTNKDGKLDSYAVVEITPGGFDRGLAFQDFQKKDTIESRLKYSIDENAGESTPIVQGCRSRNKTIVGSANGSISGGVLCDVTAWTKTQYQLSGPPSK